MEKVWVKVPGAVLETFGVVKEMKLFDSDANLQDYVDENYIAEGYSGKLFAETYDGVQCQVVQVAGQVEEVFILTELPEDTVEDIKSSALVDANQAAIAAVMTLLDQTRYRPFARLVQFAVGPLNSYDLLDTVPVQGKVVVERLDGEAAYVSPVMDSPTWLQLALCADDSIQASGDENDIYLEGFEVNRIRDDGVQVIHLRFGS